MCEYVNMQKSTQKIYIYCFHGKEVISKIFSGLFSLIPSISSGFHVKERILIAFVSLWESTNFVGGDFVSLLTLSLSYSFSSFLYTPTTNFQEIFSRRASLAENVKSVWVLQTDTALSGGLVLYTQQWHSLPKIAYLL